MKRMKEAFNLFRRSIFPSVCPFCGEPVSGEETCCVSCRKTVRPKMIKRAFSLENGRSLSCLAVFPYEAVRKAVLDLKFRDVKHNGAVFGSLMTEHKEVGQFLKGAEGLVPVPISKKRREERGYNQSELIAEALHDFCGVPVVSGLVKHRHTEAQSTLSREERLRSVKGAFSVKDDDAVEGKSVLLVDDIVTTGATLCACADALYSAGALEVRALAFSHSDFADGDRTA